jgi:hypothetical protein
MIIWQADPGFDTSGYQGAPKRDPQTLMETDGNPDGFHDILVKLRDLTIAFKKPVVLVHGDSHCFMVDKPLLVAGHPTWDDNGVHWVKALVDPQSRDVFAFQAEIVPANRIAVRSR